MAKKPLHMLLLLSLLLATMSSGQPTLDVGTFKQEKRQFYFSKDGLPDNKINCIQAIGAHVLAGTDMGAAMFDGYGWNPVSLVPEVPIVDIAFDGSSVAILAKKGEGHTIYVLGRHSLANRLDISSDFVIPGDAGVFMSGNPAYLAANNDLWEFSLEEKSFQPKSLNMPLAQVHQIADGDSVLWVGTEKGLLQYNKIRKSWEFVYPAAGDRSWAPTNVAGAVMDGSGSFWFAGRQGVGRYHDDWQLFTGQDGLPWNQFTCAAAANDGQIWFGTNFGAIRWDGEDFRYRQGKRWLPDDQVNDISVDAKGNAWFATNNGVGLVEFVPMTLAEKAKFYEDEIDKYNRRTPFGFVLEVSTDKPGDKSVVHKHDSDNDGLWTSMYGAGECYAYAATKDPKAKERARNVFEALKFLGDVTQGTEFSPDPGYVARTILPTSGPNPNGGRLERDRYHKAHHDTLWKVFEPRWPVSKDGKWYWKGDTSSDELDGHYLFYGLYYDLVADTEAEKTRVREHVRRLTDHLVSHDFQLYDHDGKPTRWARFSPKELNHDLNWAFDRGINSLSMLSYLITTAHITGDDRYRKIARELIDKHGYMQNAHHPKTQRGAGTGNQSDDEMIVMLFYNLLKYTTDPEIKSRMALSFWSYWRIVQPEMNPFFNFAIAAVNRGIICEDAWGEHQTDPTGDWLNDSAETLVRFPLDRFNWAHKNSHRLDIIHFEEWMRAFDEDSYKGRGKRVNGKVIPVDETHFNHWNHDRWRLDNGGQGTGLSDGAVFLLPYYMGLYYGFIK